MHKKPGMYASWSEAAQKLWKPMLISAVVWLTVCAACAGAIWLLSDLLAK